MKKIIRTFIVLLLVFSVFSSCKFFYQPVDTYLKEYTENCAIMRYEYSKEYPNDTTEIVNIPSEDDVSITCYLRNPQLVTLGASLTNNINDVTGFTFKQSSTDKRIVTLTIDKDYLYNTELNYAMNNSSADITTSIVLQQLNGSSILRTFEPYSISMKANTPPDIPEGVTVSNNSEKNTYLLCFNMCDMNGINADIESIKINDNSFAIKYDKTNSYGFTIPDSRFSVTSTKPSYYQKNTSNNIDFNETGLYSRPVYFDTQDTISDENKSYTIIFTDRLGLTSSITTSVKSQRIEQLSCSELHQAKIVQQTGSEYGSVKITCPTDFSDATIYYEVCATEGNYSDLPDDTNTFTKYNEGNQVSDVTLDLNIGWNRIKVFARKSGYVDSYPQIFDIYVSRVRVYVNADYTGSVNTGSSSNPFTTIKDAINSLEEPSSEDNTILLLSDVTITETIENKKNSDSVNLTIYGINSDGTYINRTISGNETLPVFSITEKAVILDYLTITKGKNTNGGTISILSGAKVTIQNNCEITDCIGTNGSAIYCSGDSGNLSIVNLYGKIHDNTAENSIIELDNYSTLNMYSQSAIQDNTCTSSSPVCVNIKENGLLNMQGGTIKDNGISNYYDVKINENAILQIQGDSFIDKTYLQNINGTVITVSGSLDNETVTSLTLADYTIDKQILSNTTDVTLNQSICDQFDIEPKENIEYCIILEENKGILKEAGIKLANIDKVELSVSSTEFNTESLQLTEDTKITMSILAKDSSGNEIDISDYITNKSMILYQDTIPVSGYSITSQDDSVTCELSLTGLYISVYQLKMSVTINGTVYSEQVNIYVKTND